jgi:hypothetical protein
MRRARNVPLILVLALSAVGLAPVAGTAGAANAPTHAVEVVGSGAVTWPEFSPDVDRYAVRPDADGSVSLVVHASTSDPAGRVRVDGRPVRDGSATVEGVEAGDEISVIVDDAGGTAAYSFIVLPSEFPVLRRTTPLDPDVTDGSVLLTLGKWLSPGSFFETAVDENGVPSYVHESPNSMDLRRQPNGRYSVARGVANGADIVELDEQFRELRRLRTTGLVHTDGHDAILNADGSAYLMAYEPNAATGLTDAVVQHVAPDGDVLFEWNSADHVDVTTETVVGSNPDYAHINSFEIMDDGDLLVSFRNLSSVFKIARHAHDGFAAGDVVWRLGGRASDFTITDTEGEPDGGPCAQHTATQLDDGNIMVFDNGAWNLNPLCIDPANPSGPPIARTPTRIAEWSINDTTMSAEMVKDFTVGDRYAIFAGSTQPLVGGNILVGWASSTQAVASELSPTGEVLWEIEAPESPRYFTYRAFKTQVPDAISPEVELAGPDPLVLSVGDTEVPGLACADRGGSNLRSCEVTGLNTASPHSGTVTVVAADGAGNRTTVRRAYTVRGEEPAPTTPVPSATPTTPTTAARHRPDLHVKVLRGSWRGVDVHDVRRGQTARDASASRRSVYRVRLRNDGTVADRFRVRLRTIADATAPRWVVHHRRSIQLEPGEAVTFRLVLRRDGRRRAVTKIVVRSVADPGARDRVWTRTAWR